MACYVCCNNCHLQGSQDARKAKLYGKLGKLIVQAVKAGGPNQGTNPLLKEALRQAHQAQLPKDVVDRNMKKASDKSQADFREVGRQSAAAHPACTCSGRPVCRLGMWGSAGVLHRLRQ